MWLCKLDGLGLRERTIPGLGRNLTSKFPTTLCYSSSSHKEHCTGWSNDLVLGGPLVKWTKVSGGRSLDLQHDRSTDSNYQDVWAGHGGWIMVPGCGSEHRTGRIAGIPSTLAQGYCLGAYREHAGGNFMVLGGQRRVHGSLGICGQVLGEGSGTYGEPNMEITGTLAMQIFHLACSTR